MNVANWPKRWSFSARKSLVKGVFLLAALQTTAIANGQVKAMPVPLPATLPPACAPSIAAGSAVQFNFTRSTRPDRDRIPILTFAAAPKAKITINAGVKQPVLLAPFVDVELDSTLYGANFSYTINNVPLDPGKGTSTIDGDKGELAGLAAAVQKAVTSMMAVDLDPRLPLVWNDPVYVTITPIFFDPVAGAAATASAVQPKAIYTKLQTAADNARDDAKKAKAKADRSQADADTAQYEAEKAQALSDPKASEKAKVAALLATKAADDNGTAGRLATTAKTADDSAATAKKVSDKADADAVAANPTAFGKIPDSASPRSTGTPTKLATPLQFILQQVF